MSTPTSLVSVVYNAAAPGPKHSWVKLNLWLKEALALAIMSEMRFHPDEIEHIFRNFKGSFWFGDGEWILRLACISGNASAARSYLRSGPKRKRFRWTQPRPPGHWSASLPGSSDGHWVSHVDELRRRRSLDLLYVGAMFTWEGEDLTVTSFDDHRDVMIACSYKDETRREVKHRHEITPAQLRAAAKSAA